MLPYLDRREAQLFLWVGHVESKAHRCTMRIKKSRLCISLESHLNSLAPETIDSDRPFDGACQYELQTTLILHFRHDSQL